MSAHYYHYTKIQVKFSVRNLRTTLNKRSLVPWTPQCTYSIYRDLSATQMMPFDFGFRERGKLIKRADSIWYGML